MRESKLKKMEAENQILLNEINQQIRESFSQDTGEEEYTKKTSQDSDKSDGFGFTVKTVMIIVVSFIASVITSIIVNLLGV